MRHSDIQAYASQASPIEMPQTEPALPQVSQSDMFKYDRQIEIAFALQPFDPRRDLQIDGHNVGEFLAFKAGEKILLENRQV